MQAGPPYFPFLDPAENRDGIEKADNQCPPLGRTEQPEPSQIDKGRAQKRDEQPVTARRFHPSIPARGTSGNLIARIVKVISVTAMIPKKAAVGQVQAIQSIMFPPVFLC